MTSRLCACLSSTHQDPGGALTSLHGGDLIFSVDGVVSAEEAARLVAFGEASGFATQFHEADDEVTFRHNDRLAIADEGFALALWERLRRHVPLVRGAEPVGCSSNIRLYKYTERIKPALAVNVPVLQLSHVRSLLAVASAVVYLPAMHGLLTASQVEVPPTAVYVTPIWHGEQLLFSVAVPAAYP